MSFRSTSSQLLRCRASNLPPRPHFTVSPCSTTRSHVRSFRAAWPPLARKVWHSQKYHGPDPPEFSPGARITIEEIDQRRKYNERLLAPTMAAMPSRTFTREVLEGDDMEYAMSWDYYLTPEASRREPSTLSSAAKRYLAVENVVSLGPGLPDPDFFPIENMGIFVHKEPFFQHMEGAMFKRIKNFKTKPGVSDYGVRDHTVAPDLRKRKIEKYELHSGREYDAAVALNYAHAAGSPQMLRFVTEHTELVHFPKYRDWACSLSIGNTGALEQIFRLLLRDGDPLLADQFAQSTMLESAWPLGIKTLGLPSDKEGIIPKDLRNLLALWDPQRDGPRPKVLYLNPTGSNPTGATMSTLRRRQIYLIAQEHNLVIIEDDPYYFLQFNLRKMPGRGEDEDEDEPAMPDVFMPKHPETWACESLIPSFLSIDTDGRVIRLDSFSQSFAPGARMGWVTGPEQVIDRFIRHNEVTSQGPSGLSQLFLFKIMDASDGGWGHAGYFDFLQCLADQYKRKRNVLVQALEKNLSEPGMEGIVRYEVPDAGMFLWITFDHALHREYPEKSIMELEEDIFGTCISKGLLLSRGSWFLTNRPEGEDYRFPAVPSAPTRTEDPEDFDEDEEKDLSDAYSSINLPASNSKMGLPSLSFRLSFSSASTEDIQVAAERLSQAVKQVYNIQESTDVFFEEMGKTDPESDKYQVEISKGIRSEAELWKPAANARVRPKREFKKKQKVDENDDGKLVDLDEPWIPKTEEERDRMDRGSGLK